MRRQRVRKIIDPSVFNDPALESYLAADGGNIALLTDYAAMEAYKAIDPVRGISTCTQILARFPEQVAVLKNTQKIVTLNWREKGLPRRFIDEALSRNFSGFCRQLARAQAGDVRCLSAIRAHRRAAVEHLDRVLRDAALFQDSFRAVESRFTVSELKTLRRRNGYTDAMIDKMTRDLFMLAAHLIATHPKKPSLPMELGEALNTYVFRYALCGYFYTLGRVRQGASELAPETIRNDYVDLSYVAYATFFDGVMSKDRKMLERYAEAMFYLEVFRACVTGRKTW